MWFFMIMRVAIQVLKGAAADDVRSDDEEEVEDDLEEETLRIIEEPEDAPPPYEEEVGVESLSFNNKKANGHSRMTRKSSSSSTSGISLPHDRKELLGRIGCDKTT